VKYNSSLPGVRIPSLVLQKPGVKPVTVTYDLVITQPSLSSKVTVGVTQLHPTGSMTVTSLAPKLMFVSEMFMVLEFVFPITSPVVVTLPLTRVAAEAGELRGKTKTIEIIEATIIDVLLIFIRFPLWRALHSEFDGLSEISSHLAISHDARNIRPCLVAELVKTRGSPYWSTKND
jgi:fumarate reductase subunit D